MSNYKDWRQRRLEKLKEDAKYLYELVNDIERERRILEEKENVGS